MIRTNIIERNPYHLPNGLDLCYLMGFKKTNQKRAFYEMLKIFCVQTLFCYIGIGRVYIILSETIGLSLDHKTQMFVQRMTLSRCHTNIKMYMLMVP